MNITGKIHAIKETQQVTATFSKREFVIVFIDGNPEYPQYIPFQVVQDRVGLIDGYQVGQEIEVEYNLRGREWTSPQGEVRHFMSLEAWKITPVGAQQPVTAAPVGAGTGTPPANGGAVDDLPF